MSSEVDEVHTSGMEYSDSDGDSNISDPESTRRPAQHSSPRQHGRTSRTIRPAPSQDSSPRPDGRTSRSTPSSPSQDRSTKPDGRTSRSTRPAPSQDPSLQIDSPIPLKDLPVQLTPGGAPQERRRLEGVQKWVVVILVVALCASLCHSLAFASGSWMQNGNTHIGLWMDCNCTTYRPGGDSMKWLTSSKVFLGMALLIAVGSAFTIPVYTALEVTSRREALAELFYKCADGTVGMTLIGCLPAGLLFDIDYKLGVGFGLSVTAALLCTPKHALLALKNQEDFRNKFNWPHTAITLSYLIAVHFLLVCYATSSWASSGNTHVGLWMNCACGGSTFQDDALANVFKAVQAMITVGEILLFINVIIIAVIAGLPITNSKRNTLITCIYIISFAAGLTTVIADVMFATKIVEGYSLGFSFIFSILSAVFCIIAACIAVLRRSSERSQTTPRSAA